MTLLLPNGDLMVHGSNSDNNNDPGSPFWYLVTPDSTGGYQNGTWTQIASMNVSRLYFGSVVLPNGNVFVVGGEYASDQSLSNSAEIYNPKTNVWTMVASDPQPYVGDEPTELLPNGNVLVGNVFNNGTEIYNPTTNTWTAGGAKVHTDDRSDEEPWVKLPNGDILTYDIFSSINSGVGTAELYNPTTNTWSDASNGTLPVLSTPSEGYELGAAVMLTDGRALFTGANGLTAFYNTTTNSWSQGPNMPIVTISGTPTQLTMGDAPAAVLPNGDVLMSLSPAVNGGNFPGPTYIYDFNATTGVFTDVTPSSSLIDLSSNSFTNSFLVLPTGQVMLNDYTSNPLIYTPSGSPDPSWRPQVTSFIKNANGSYTLTGTQLNGLDEGAAYGDDEQMAENYPIVQFTDKTTGLVYYGTTSNWSSVGVATGTTPETVNVALPTALKSDPYTFVVIANGIASTPFSSSTLVITQMPTTGTAGKTLGTVTVSIENQNNGIVTGDNSVVTLSIASGPGGFTAGSTVSVNAVNGVATFTNLTLDTAGSYKLSATDPGDAGATSATSLVINPAQAAKLVFLQVPSSGKVGSPLSPVTVAIEDQFGNVVVNNKSNVTIAPVAGAGGFTTGSTVSLNAVNGIATFKNLVFANAGVFTLGATDNGLSGATSTSIAVPLNVSNGFTLTLKVLTPNSVELDWPSVLGVQGYRVFYYNGKTNFLLTTVPAGTTRYQIVGLLPATTYQFHIEAYYGKSTLPSTSVSYTTAAKPVAVIVPPSINLENKNNDQFSFLNW